MGREEVAGCEGSEMGWNKLKRGKLMGSWETDDSLDLRHLSFNPGLATYQLQCPEQVTLYASSASSVK